MRSLLQTASEDVIEARANVFSALGEETRLRIFHEIATAEDALTVTQICERADVAPNLASHHLKCLRNCGLVETEPDGRKRFYDVDPEEAVTLLAVADECIDENPESVLTCEVLREEERDDRSGR